MLLRGEALSCAMEIERNRGTNSVRITVLCSVIVIDVIVRCHTAGAL